MVQLQHDEILGRLIAGTASLNDALYALIDRQSGRFSAPEGQLLDYKREVVIANINSIAEISRDILGFSNTDGGVLVLGVNDDMSIRGHDKLDSRRFRDAIGPYIGTRADFDLEECSLTVVGNVQRLTVIVVRRSHTMYPNQLRRDIELRPGLVRKLKYVRGTLFYRRGDQTIAESPSGDIEGRARELRFSGAAPRTSTSFLLQEDKPGLRLYAPINDRFFGRQSEIAELIAKFDDPRGRGVSIAGFGGVGKTELAIHLVTELYSRGKFRSIYSGSAKQTLLAPGGTQQTDPVFIDLPSFLSDLAGWLGLNPPRLTVDKLQATCLEELAKYKKVLLFVDNLETVNDRELLNFLDNAIPSNCWLVATSRAHKIRNFIYPKELREMEASDAARLLRHELKRQGLDELASAQISELQEKAISLYLHPLAIRWFAWAVRKDAKIWKEGIGKIDIRELEDFCVAHTLGSLGEQTQRVLGAILAIEGVATPNDECIQHTSGLPESRVEFSLWELECSGMVSAVADSDGFVTYAIAPLAERPAEELARNKGWEAGYVQNLRSYVKHRQDAVPDSPLVRDLLKLEPRSIKDYTEEEKRVLIARIDRALPRCPEKLAPRLKALKAECLRHLDSLVSADELYKECAEFYLNQGPIDANDRDKARIILEAATVARARIQTELQLRRAVTYLEAIRDTEYSALRVLGTLTELYSLLGDRENYERALRRAESYRDSQLSIGEPQLSALNDALERAKLNIERKFGKHP